MASCFSRTPPEKYLTLVVVRYTQFGPQAGTVELIKRRPRFAIDRARGWEH